MSVSTEAGALRRLADELEIRNLLMRRTHLIDGDGIDAYVSCWTEDAVHETIGGPLDRGHAGMREHAERGRQRVVETGIRGRHVVTNLVVTLDGPDQATCESILTVMTDTQKTPSIVSLYKSRDSVRRTPQGWKVAYRLSTPVSAAG